MAAPCCRWCRTSGASGWSEWRLRLQPTATLQSRKVSCTWWRPVFGTTERSARVLTVVLSCRHCTAVHQAGLGSLLATFLSGLPASTLLTHLCCR